MSGPSVKLHPEEINTAFHYHQQKNQQRFIISRGILRTLLATYCNQLPQDILFDKDANKKPVMHNGYTHNPHFNIAHSDDVLLPARLINR